MSKLLGGVAGTIAKVGGGVALGAVVFDSAIYTVEPGHRALIFDRLSGIKDEVKGEGAHFMIPVLQVIFPRVLRRAWCVLGLGWEWR
jgi:regulator of protease activity HflC (stomatin/prohibitin superfamily)